MPNTIQLFILTTNSHVDGKSQTDYFNTLEEAQKEFDSLLCNPSANTWTRFKLGKATLELIDGIDFFHRSKPDDWLRMNLKSVRWLESGGTEKII